MCGIAGLIMKKGRIETLPASLKKMTQLIEHRGPDGEGHYIYNNIGLGHRRLAIIDLSKDGHQPMSYHNEQLVITYNGEIYNYIEIREQLEQLGYNFHSKTDTEVILAAYSEWGTECVSRFNGMWAFVLFDKEKKILFASRDRFGVKPFYYLNTPECFALGSEIRQLLAFTPKIRANKTLLLDFILTSISDHSDETYFQDIQKLPASHNMTYFLETNCFKIERYYELQENSWSTGLSTNETIEHFMHLLEDAVNLRLRADVAVGTCLSGGLDSSTVASIASPIYRNKSGRSFNGITAVSEQESNNEAGYAQKVIEMSQMDWLQIKPSYSDFHSSLPAVILAQEEPFGSPSLTMQYFVMKTAKEHGIPVLLDGQGGDEVLLGYGKYYGSYLATMIWQQGLIAFTKAIRSAKQNNKQLSFVNAIKFMAGSTLASLRFMYYCRKHTYLSSHPALPEHLSLFSKSSWNVFQLQKLEMERTNLPVLLRYEDKNSMAHSIETRLPFLDYRVVEAALSLPGKFKIHEGWSKWILRKGMETRMPESIAWRKNKFGFEAPEDIWLKQHYDHMLSSVKDSSLLAELASLPELVKQYGSLDMRSQWRLYSIVLWEKAFGVQI